MPIIAGKCPCSWYPVYASLLTGADLTACWTSFWLKNLNGSNMVNELLKQTVQNTKKQLVEDS